MGRKLPLAGRRLKMKRWAIFILCALFLGSGCALKQNQTGNQAPPKQTEVSVPTRDGRLETLDLLNTGDKLLASYATFFDQTKTNRVHNIQLSSEAINGHVLNVGEVFSFNQVVGKRTPQRGYLPAPEIVKGEYTEGIGGGVCQTSSTLYNAADAAGLRIIERVSHSHVVTYVPKGRDATVSWKEPDFKFQNQLNVPIRIAAKTQNGRITVAIYAPAHVNALRRKVAAPPTTLPEIIRVTPDEPMSLDPKKIKRELQNPLRIPQ
ncbi:VanW family protein [Thermoactinomyces daqus]|jgi:vancomycin resistance protein YoaR|uniref:VanW family protein n=2 Tax=Thermoactinomycetaceae TaxID=186824 RepID=A0A7W1X7K2_9BACL|nr:VanW family protein [Thermoactinomyces daqus]MBH8596968.1 VanW family protein [Thermoactinomyces sp. CICC 10523]MBH8603744.1 VanW family protein [Thermoactinomyces sp. CICC 10522]